MEKTIVALAGATASGKTSLGIKLAKRFNGEIVSCDSMQIYRHLNIGTAKPTEAERREIVHHMIDVAEPEEEFSVGKFSVMAREKIEDILARGKLPILVGGTGLYIENTVYKTDFSAPMRNDGVTAELMEYASTYGNDALYELLKKEDPQAAQKLHKNDVKRVVRAIETYRATGKTRSELDSESRRETPYDCLWLAIDMERSILYERINARVDEMLSEGLIEETKREILPKREKLKTAIQAIGYKEILMYLDDLCSASEASELLKRNTRRLAKRQLTWFRRNEEINWLKSENAFKQAEALIKERIGTKL